jgi:hypothetical protein
MEIIFWIFIRCNLQKQSTKKQSKRLGVRDFTLRLGQIILPLHHRVYLTKFRICSFNFGTNWMCTQHFSIHSVRERERVVRIRSGLVGTQSSCLQAAQSPWLGVVLSAPQQRRAAAAGVDQLGQELASQSTSTGQSQEHHCSCTQHQDTLEHHPIYSMDWTIEAEDQGKVEQSLTRRRRQATRSWPRRRRAGKPGHDQGGEGQATRVVITASRTSSNSKPSSRPHHPYLNHRLISLQIIQASIAKICLHAWMDWESISLRLAKWCFA